jgi:DNA-binding IclR family transcriptional regulator
MDQPANETVRTIDERYRVQSLGRALDLIEMIAVRGRDGARLTDLARELGMSKAAVYALLQTLLARGFLSDVSEGANRRYRLGLSLTRLGDMALANIAIADAAMPWWSAVSTHRDPSASTPHWGGARCRIARRSARRCSPPCRPKTRDVSWNAGS